MGGDKDVRVRCAASSFDVKDGLMTSRAVVLDTTDTIVYGKGTANFGTEQLDVWLHPYPKDKSILSLRSPINIGGTFGAPKVSPDKKALMERGAAALLSAQSTRCWRSPPRSSPAPARTRTAVPS